MYNRSDHHLDAWCAQIPGLRKAAVGHWTASTNEVISFPLAQHESLAKIEPQSYWFGHRNSVIASVVRRYPPSGPILDVGGGNGFVAMNLLAEGFPAIVVEPGPVAVRVCIERGVPVIEAALQDLELEVGSVDAVGMFDVLEHIEDDAATLARLHSLLKPHGRLYLTVPAYTWLWSPEDVDAGHFRRYTLGRLATTLRAAGFEVEYQTYIFAALVPPLFLLRTMMGWFGYRKAGDSGQATQEHKLPGNVVGWLLKWSLRREAKRIAFGGRVSFGTSCLAVARATTSSQEVASQQLHSV